MAESHHNLVPPNYSKDLHATNTYSQAPSCPQIFAYLMIIGQIVVFYVCVHSILRNWVLFGLYTFFTVLLIAFYLSTSCIDPTDRTVYEYKWALQQNKPYQRDFNELSYCEDCEALCEEDSKHCRSCNRCVSRFDHHCVWVNNCIGEANYLSFILMIFSALFQIIIFIVGSGMAAVYIDDHLRIVLPPIIFTIITGLFSIFLLALIIFHIYLMCIGLTTFEFIVGEKRKPKNQIKTNQRQEREEKTSQMEKKEKVQVKEEKIEQEGLKKEKAQREQQKQRQKLQSQSVKRSNLLLGSLQAKRPKKNHMHKSSIN